MKLQWKNPRTDGAPERIAPCFIKVGNSVQIAYWRDDANEWDNMTYGWLPRVYDDEGAYPIDVIAWAYIPDELLDEFNFEHCKCYKPNYYGDNKNRCFGTKEIEICSCGGNRLRCNFYD